MSSRSIEYPKSVNVVELESAAFKCAKDADAWARNHGIVGLMSNVDTGGKGEISISVNSLNKMLSGSALREPTGSDLIATVNCHSRFSLS